MNDSSKRLEFTLAFNADPSRASAAMKALTADAQRLDRMAQEAQRSLSRMSLADRAMAGGTYGVQGGVPTSGYGVNYGHSGGQSKASAYAGSGYQPPMPGGGPGVVSRTVSGGVPVTGGGGGGGMGGPEGWMVIASKAAGAAGMVMGLASALDKLGTSVENFRHGAAGIDPGGQRLGTGNMYLKAGVDSATSIPVVGWGLRAGAGLMDQAADNITGWRTDARQRLENAQFGAIAGGPMMDAERAIRDAQQQGRYFGNTAGASAGFAASERYRLPWTAAEMMLHPEVAGAQMAQRRADSEFGAAGKNFGDAGSQVDFHQERVNRLQGELASRRSSSAGTVGMDFAMSALIPSMGMYSDARRLEELNKQKELESAIDDLKKAQNNKLQSGIDLSQKRLAVDQAALGVSQARIAVLDRDIGQVSSGALGLAGMDGLQKDSLVTAAKKLKMYGPGALTREEAGLVQSTGYGGEAYAKQIAAYVDKTDPVATVLRELSGQSSLANLNGKKQIEVGGTLELTLAKSVTDEMVNDLFQKLLPGMSKAIIDGSLGKVEGAKIEINNGKAAQAGQ